MAATPGRPNTWSTLAKLIAALVAAGVLVAGLALPYVGGLGLVAGHEADKFTDTTCNLQESKPPQRTTLYANDGKTVIATLFSQDRVPVPLTSVPQQLQNALIATEDRRFYSHHGVDLRGLIRSAVNTSNGDTQGGSTLTMQYVKQIRYFQAVEANNKRAANAAISQNINRKIEDAKCALYIEGTLGESKSKILDNYLNIAFFGENSYGIQTAAETYFNKPVSSLTLDQSALLVGLLQAPTDYDPFQHAAAAKQRRNEVIQNLVAVGKLSQASANGYKARPVALATSSPPQIQQGCANSASTIPNASFFCEYAVQWLKNTNKISETQLQTGGLKIVTTLDPKLQTSAQEHLDKTIPAGSPMTAVLPAVDPKTGNVLAMATSKTYGTKKNQTEQPVFTSETANGASTYKLFPLLAALATGVPKDWPILTAGNSGTYKPKNCSTQKEVSNGDANESYNEQETLETAAAKSSNTYFVALADLLFHCELSPIIDLAQKLGMNGLNAPSDSPGLTVAQAINNQQRAQQLVLGSVPTSPLELAGAYAAVANGGKFNAPAPILSITDSSGNAIAVKRSAGVQVVDPQTAATAVHILTGDTQDDNGTEGTSAGKFDEWYAAGLSKVAGKTGTTAAINQHGKETQNNAAIWFVGMTPNLVATSALINFNYPNRESTGLPGIGNGKAYGDYASHVWLRTYQPMLATQKSWSWVQADEVKGGDVPDITGAQIPDAKKTLAEAGYKLRLLDPTDAIHCPSHTVATYGAVAYYGPDKAPAGSTILVCPSLGVGQPIYVPPPPVIIKPTHGSGSGSGSGHGSGNGSGSGGDGSGSGGTGTGSGGGSGGTGTGSGGSGGGSGGSGSGSGGSGSGGSGGGSGGSGGGGSGGGSGGSGGGGH